MYEGNQEFKLQMPNRQVKKALGYASLGFREQVRDGYINCIVIRAQMASKATDQI